MVSAIPARAWLSFADSEFQRCTTSLNRAAAGPPQTDGGTASIREMKPCNNARMSSFRPSVAAATDRISSKSVLRVVIAILPALNSSR